ncbi:MULTISPECIES: hypothetical protein [Nostocales]|jgi:hypothetical protein|uniref:Uncharacterized protein n=1 Tax=Dolichospermum flos-aquae UHCC 0037 TaxID=2590026 RepID=A0ACC7S9C5_DOLFA|nr:MULTISPECIES: hypothetical protein [Nostocales]MCX5982422.1 hypothetical protein [Nostocales cyanobacterium LacPavin_0920_SED1_MAG_38_18]MDK2410785.1 hypothetical protein [Aphanizomenon sp. 202]MDK2460671.1 hypothetical protein [Aphanizomenon sp. PH219]MDP5018268.1 hypothetical protein [Dolichospermum sp.]ALB41594.1 hypothetical protein AA650_14995 [Anabaena sp. WA102]
MNTQLVESITQIILSLSPEERQLLESKINNVKLSSPLANSTQQDISDLEQKLKNFETKYQMSSGDFYQEFQAGKLGDEIDFFEWSVFYEMWTNAQNTIQINTNLIAS